METKNHDWHSADVKCALEKSGTNLTKLAREHGLAPATLRNIFRMRWPKGERIVAAALNEKPENIWPSRYEKKVA
ncbi:helix-turn-helix transcriptional regulator [Shewanella baltica]|uniref:helix-turn-helix domain-containing protein n=1 Tax=Shewanella baltica TaxID=62322 RepID=UPI0030D34208